MLHFFHSADHLDKTKQRNIRMCYCISNGLHKYLKYSIQKTKEYTVYSAPHENFPKLEHILGYKTNLYKFKKPEITICALSGQNAIKHKINTNWTLYKWKAIKCPIIHRKKTLEDQIITKEGLYNIQATFHYSNK